MANITTNISNGYKITLTVTQTSQSVTDNTSVLSWSYKISCGSAYYQNSSTKDTFKAVINGTTVLNVSKAISFSGSNTTITIASGTLNVSHNTDGTKTVNISCSYAPGKSASYYPSSMSGNGTMTLTVIPRASPISVVSGNGTKPGAGTVVLSISRASTSFTHTVTWSCGGRNGTVGTGLTTSASWPVPISLITVSPNAYQKVTFTCATYNGAKKIGEKTCTATVGYYTASTMESTGRAVGSKVSFTVARGNSNFTHTLTYVFGSVNGTVASKSTETSLSFTPSLNTFGAQIPNATSGALTCRLTTYYGSTQIGSTRSYTYTLSMPSSAVPAINSTSISEGNSAVSSLIGTYVQNRSILKLSMTAEGVYGSTIKSYKITGCGKTISAAEGTTSTVTVNGSQTITYIVTDSRGRTAKATRTISILPYNSPAISKAKAVRSDTSIAVSATLKCTSLIAEGTEKNSLRYKIRYRIAGESIYTDVAGTYSALSQILSKTITGLDASKSYELLVYTGDVFGYSSAYQPLNVSTAFRSFDFDVKTGRVAVGKYLEAGASYSLETAKSIISREKIISDEAIYAGGKTAIADGNSGCVLGRAGGMALVGNTPNIDFHYNNATERTHRIVADTSSTLSISSGLKVSGSITTEGYVHSRNGFNLRKSDGTNSSAVRFNDDQSYMYYGNASYGTRLYGSAIYLRGTSEAVTSDERLKKDFKSVDVYEGFFMSLKPYAFRYIEGTSNRFHLGFKAQDVKKVLEENGMSTSDFAGYKEEVQEKEDAERLSNILGENPIDDGTERYLSYSEFIPLNTYMIQKCMRMLEEQQKEIDELRKQNELLMKMINREEK